MNIKEKTIRLIDDLKATCQVYGLGNDGNEYKIITQIFLFKFLNDKFGYELTKTARAWVRNRAPKTSLVPSAKNAELFKMLGRATEWLRANAVTNPILTWDTPQWGEIPADFGRK